MEIYILLWTHTVAFEVLQSTCVNLHVTFCATLLVSAIILSEKYKRIVTCNYTA